jgi:DNA-binding IclR family transcriptional regulator
LGRTEGSVMAVEKVAGNDRIVAVLEQLVSQGSDHAWGVRALADQLGESRSTVNRVLQALVDEGFASTSDGPASAGANAAYTVGPRLRVLAGALHRTHPLLSDTPVIAQHLSRSTDATVVVALHAAPKPLAFVAVAHQRPGPVRYALEPGDLVPLHAGATGRAILGRLGTAVLGDEPLDRRTPDTVVDREKLERLLREDRERGFVISVGQQIQLAAGVSAPFEHGGFVGSVSITKPRYLTSDEDLESYGPMARDAAASVAALPAGHLIVHASDQPTAGSAVQRMTRLLAALTSQTQGIPAGRSLSQAVGGNPATTARLLETAQRSGLALVQRHLVHAGPTLLRWAARLGQAPPVVQLAMPALHELAATSRETVGITQFDDQTQTATMAAVIPGLQPLHYSLASGLPIPLHAGAAGKAILAHCPALTVDKQVLEPLTERTPSTRAQLEEQLEQIREQGYAVADGERIPDAFGIGAPYFSDGSIAGSITVTIPRYRVHELDLAQLTQQVRTTAATVTTLLTV